MESAYVSIFQKFQKEIIAALVLIVLSAGVTTISEEPYNPYEQKVQEIDSMMQDALNNPSMLGAAQKDIFYEYYPWAERQTDSRKDTFIAYLEACNQVIIQKSHGEEPDTSEMNRLYNLLN